MPNWVAGAPGLLEPYQAPGPTPYPQGAGYGLGVAANTLVRNIIAKQLIDQALTQQQRENALQGLNVLSREPGALRTAGGPLFSQAGINVDVNQIPQSKEEMVSSIMRAGVDTVNRLRAGELNPESLTMSDLIGLSLASPETAKHIFDLQRLKQSWNLVGGLIGNQPGSAAGAPPDTSAAPPTAPTGTVPGLFGQRQRTTRQIGISPSGGPEVNVSTVTEPPTKEEMELAAIERVRPEVEAQVDALIQSGRLNMPSSWTAAEISPEDFRSAHVTRMLQQRLPSMEVRGPKLSELSTNAANYNLAKAREANANFRDAASVALMERLRINGEQLDLATKRYELSVKEANAREAARDKTAMLQAHKTKIDGLKSLISLEESAMRQELLIDPNIRNTNPRLRDLYKQYNDAVADYSKAAGLPIVSTQLRGSLPGEWFKEPTEVIQLPTPRGTPPAPGTPPTTTPSLQQIIEGYGGGQ